VIIGIVNGPNLGRLGRREPDVYGTTTLADIVAGLAAWAEPRGIRLEAVQSNHEGALIDALEAGEGRWAGAVLNAGALTHYAWALYDCVKSLPYPVVEVHMSNIYAREGFRAHSVLAPVVRGHIVGFGVDSYRLGLIALARLLGVDADAGR
jgi:3-dehydroquinate dehydratase-2